MNFCWKTVLCLYIFVPGPASAGDKWSDDFSTSELNRGLWCPCQIDMNKAPIEFLQDADDAGNQYARITVDINSLGGNVCRKAAPDDECGKPIPALALSPDQARTVEPDMPKLLAPVFIEDPKITPVAAIHSSRQRMLALSFGLASNLGHARAQNPLIITAPVSAQTVDGTLAFSGTASVNAITRRGTICGKTNDRMPRGNCRQSCDPQGEGRNSCGQHSAQFEGASDSGMAQMGLARDGHAAA